MNKLQSIFEAQKLENPKMSDKDIIILMAWGFGVSYEAMKKMLAGDTKKVKRIA